MPGCLPFPCLYLFLFLLFLSISSKYFLSDCHSDHTGFGHVAAILIYMTQSQSLQAISLFQFSSFLSHFLSFLVFHSIFILFFSVLVLDLALHNIGLIPTLPFTPCIAKWTFSGHQASSIIPYTLLLLLLLLSAADYVLLLPPPTAMYYCFDPIWGRFYFYAIVVGKYPVQYTLKLSYIGSFSLLW